jgi:hypothetical protein
MSAADRREPIAMQSKPASSRLAATSLTMGILGWIFYLLQWCFDFTLGLILALASGGASAVCASILDVLPFVLWLVGVVSGHAALAQIKRTGGTGRRQAGWGLALSYLGLFFTLLFIVVIVVLIAAGVGTGFFEKYLPAFPKH